MPIQRSRLTARADIDRIVQGERVTITVEIFDTYTNQALDLTGITAAAASFPGTAATVTKSLGAGVTVDDEAGRLAVALSATDTAAMKAGEEQSWQISVTTAGGDVRIVQLEEALDVAASLF